MSSENRKSLKSQVVDEPEMNCSVFSIKITGWLIQGLGKQRGQFLLYKVEPSSLLVPEKKYSSPIFLSP